MTKTFVPRATNGQIFPWNNVRLPPYIKPTRYNITIHPNLTTLEVKGAKCFCRPAAHAHLPNCDRDAKRFVLHVCTCRNNHVRYCNVVSLLSSGQVSIEFHVEKDTHFIVLHSKNLSITDKVTSCSKRECIALY